MLQLRFILLLFSLALLRISIAQCPQGCLCGRRTASCFFAKTRFQSVPEGISRSVTLLDLNGNHIRFLDSRSFAGMSNLTHLYLRGNTLEFISAYTFSGNRQLHHLDLSNNNIREMQPYTFRDLTKLETLNLNGNQITQLHKHTFDGMSNLRTLLLANNQLQEVPQTAMKRLKSLANLRLTGNQLRCDCSAAWMKDFAPMKSPSAGSVVCAGPGPLAGRKLESIPLADFNCVLPTSQPVQDYVEAFKGDQVSLQCNVTGDPPPSISWLFRGEQLTSNLYYKLLANGTLVITGMIASLDGQYVCVAENLVGSSNASITVEYRGARLPVFLISPISMHVFVGESFTLDCTADQFTLSYRWEKDGRTLSPSSSVVIEAGEFLTIYNASQEDSGVYTCIAVGENGENTAQALVNVTGQLLTCDGILSQNELLAAKERVDLAFNTTQQELRGRAASPSALLRRLKFPRSGTVELLKAAEVFEQAIEMVRNRSGGAVPTGTTVPELTPCELSVLANLSGCMEHLREASCSNSCFHSRYRSLDGTCNNLDRPLQGAASTPFLRLMQPAYEDGLGLPVGWSGGKPSARQVSRSLLHADVVQPSENLTHMLMQFGQFLDHDLDLAPSSPSDIVFSSDGFVSCDDICSNDAPCFPIPVPEDDPRIHRACIPFTRSSAVCGTGASSLLVGPAAVHRQQLNAITAYLDASQVYGSDSETARSLRDPKGGGRLLTQQLPTGQPFLPFDQDSLIECSTGIHANRSECFLAGDKRANEQVGLTSMHALFLREHNRIARELGALNTHWDDEQLYQEARRVVIAEWQNIVFTEYLPNILGPSGITMLSTYNGYDPTVDASIANSFATAAFRFGHSQIMPLFARLDTDYLPLPTGPLKLQDAFFAPFRLLEEGGIDPLIRGLIASPVKLRSSLQGLNSNLTEALFAQAHEVALDLASLNIQRGRDHGLRSYSHWRAFCGLQQVQTIDDLRGEISSARVRGRLREVYGDDPDEIDLWVGGLLEDVVPGSQLGPTFLCIVADQFRRLRLGDRFWYERAGQFSPDQLVQLQQASLSRIICDNADNITRVPRRAFVLQPPSQFVSCDHVPTVNLALWRECGGACEGAEEQRKRRATMVGLFQSLSDRVMQLESKVSTRQVDMCIFNSTFYANGASWRLDECTYCSCSAGGVYCSRPVCPPLSCSHPTKTAGQCCAQC